MNRRKETKRFLNFADALALWDNMFDVKSGSWEAFVHQAVLAPPISARPNCARLFFRDAHYGCLPSNNRETIVETGDFLSDAQDVGNVVVGVSGGRPVYLREVADIKDDAQEPSQYVFFGGGAARSTASAEQPAVTLTIAKRPGANAIAVADQVLKKIEALRGKTIPNDIQVSITRNYGRTAAEKSNELLWHMGIAVIGVSLLILLTLGWREACVVAIAIPSTLALTLLVFYLYGYTLNRITLFALIFSIGILVDDAIVVVENIVRPTNLCHRGKGPPSCEPAASRPDGREMGRIRQNGNSE